MRIGDDLAGDPATGRPDDRLIGIGDDDGVLAAEAYARPPVPGQFHGSILAQADAPRRTAACTRRRRDPLRWKPRPRERMSGGACPIGAPARREGGWNPMGSVR